MDDYDQVQIHLDGFPEMSLSGNSLGFQPLQRTQGTHRQLLFGGKASGDQLERECNDWQNMSVKGTTEEASGPLESVSYVFICQYSPVVFFPALPSSASVKILEICKYFKSSITHKMTPTLQSQFSLYVHCRNQSHQRHS